MYPQKTGYRLRACKPGRQGFAWLRARFHPLSKYDKNLHKAPGFWEFLFDDKWRLCYTFFQHVQNKIELEVKSFATAKNYSSAGQGSPFPMVPTEPAAFIRHVWRIDFGTNPFWD